MTNKYETPTNTATDKALTQEDLIVKEEKPNKCKKCGCETKLNPYCVDCILPKIRKKIDFDKEIVCAEKPLPETICPLKKEKPNHNSNFGEVAENQMGAIESAQVGSSKLPPPSGEKPIVPLMDKEIRNNIIKSLKSLEDKYRNEAFQKINVLREIINELKWQN